MAKIGIDARFYSSSFTGIGRYTAEIIKHLAEMESENEYVIFLNDPQYGVFIEPNERFKKVLVNAKHYSLAEQTKFLQKIKGEKLDLMHFTHFNAPMFYKGKSIVTIHDLTLEMYPGKKMTNLFFRMGYNLILKNIVSHSEKILTVSKHTKSDLMNIMGVKEEKIKVTYNGISPEFCPEKNEEIKARIKKEYGLDRPYFLYTGVWRTHKNLKRLVEAFAVLRKKYGQDVLLVLTGKPDSIYSEIPQTIKKLGLEEYVKRVGLVPEEELPGLYSMASAYCFPSLYEGFGLPPLEAMACGTPVVASLASSIPEVCGERNAFYFDPLNTDEIAESMYKVLTDEESAEENVKNGLEQVKKFDWKNTTSQTLEAYKEILGVENNTPPILDKPE